MKSASIAAATFAFTLLAVACTTTTTTTEPTTTEKDAGSTKDAGSKDSGKTTGDDDDDTTAKSCGDEADADACTDCCISENQAGAKVYIEALVACACKADVCATECESTYCAATPKNPDATCNACLDEKLQASCEEELGTKCTASKDCMSFNSCMNTCPAQ